MSTPLIPRRRSSYSSQHPLVDPSSGCFMDSPTPSSPYSPSRRTSLDSLPVDLILHILSCFTPIEQRITLYTLSRISRSFYNFLGPTKLSHAETLALHEFRFRDVAAQAPEIHNTFRICALCFQPAKYYDTISPGATAPDYCFGCLSSKKEWLASKFDKLVELDNRWRTEDPTKRRWIAIPVKQCDLCREWCITFSGAHTKTWKQAGLVVGCLDKQKKPGNDRSAQKSFSTTLLEKSFRLFFLHIFPVSRSKQERPLPHDMLALHIYEFRMLIREYEHLLDWPLEHYRTPWFYAHSAPNFKWFGYVWRQLRGLQDDPVNERWKMMEEWTASDPVMKLERTRRMVMMLEKEILELEQLELDWMELEQLKRENSLHECKMEKTMTRILRIIGMGDG